MGSGVTLEDLLNLRQDRRLTLALPYHLAKSPLGEAGPEAGIIGVAPERLQGAFGKLKDLEDLGDPGVVLSEGPGKGSDARRALCLQRLSVTFGTLPGRLLVHPMLVGLPGAGLGWPVAAKARRGRSADERPAASPVNCEVVVYQEDRVRKVSGFLKVRIPDQRALLEAGSGLGPQFLSCPLCATSAKGEV